MTEVKKDISNTKIEEAFGKVREWIIWYQRNAETANISDLQNVQDQLSTWSYFIGEELAIAFSESSMSYFTRKIHVARKKINLINNKGMSGTAADAASIVKSEEYLMSEQKTEAYTNEVKILLDQINRIVRTISQRISNLKKEMEHTRTNQI